MSIQSTTALSRGTFIKKDRSGTDEDQRDDAMERLSAELSDAVTHMSKFRKDYDEGAKVLKELRDKVEKMDGKVDGELREQLTKAGADLAESLTRVQACEEAIETFKKEMDSPLYKGGSDLIEKDRENAIELQRRAHIFKGGEADDFRADLDNLVNPADYRSACRKLMKVGLESKARVIRDFTDGERKAFDAASLDSAFFMPEMLGLEVDCEIECFSILDLYMQVSVSRSNYMYPHVESYGDIGQYDCDAKCDAEYGPEGNITWKNGQTHDFRGVFCFQRDTLREANYDLLGFMMRAAARSHRINRNRVLIEGDGVNEPLGWLTADCFTKVQAPSANPTHQDLRLFLTSHPVEYGPVVPVMHQNVFAYFASMVDNDGRFLFGDGLMAYTPDDVRENIRISNCLPDPTEGQTLGSEANPFVTGSFIMAAADWSSAYANVSHRPLFMEQFEGGSTAWCVKYQFGAKDGGFVACCPAGRTFIAGASAAVT